MIKYVFADDEPLRIKAAKDADAQTIGEELARIGAQHEGRLKPDDVVSAARAPDNPLHRHFEWNDEAAAEAYRLDQARSIIRVVRVADVDDEPKRAYVSISDKAGTAYRAIGEVRTSVDLQARLLAQAEKDLEAMEKRYRSISMICEGVKELREKLKRKAEKESRPAA